MANLFNKAKKASPKKSKAKDEKPRITIQDEDFFDKIEKLENLNKQVKSTTAKAKVISDEIKETGKEEWLKLYSDKGKNPGTVMLENRKDMDIAQAMFTPTDKYITVDENRAKELIETYDEDIVEENTTYSFDQDMIEKYAEVLSEMIENSDEIEEDDKDNIIKASTKYSVKKGTIDKLNEYGEDIGDIFEDVKPVVMIKKPEILNLNE